MFFQSSDPALRKEIDVISHPDHITQQETGKGIDIVTIPVSTKLMGYKVVGCGFDFSVSPFPKKNATFYKTREFFF